MRWETEKSAICAKPKLGDKRERRRFAIIPVRIHDKWVWLEPYFIIQERREVPVRHEEVVDSGIIFEKYREVYVDEEWWIRIGRRLPDGEPYIFESYR